MSLWLKTNVGNIYFSHVLPEPNLFEYVFPEAGNYVVDYLKQVLSFHCLSKVGLNWDGKEDIVFENGAKITPVYRDGVFHGIDATRPDGEVLTYRNDYFTNATINDPNPGYGTLRPDLPGTRKEVYRIIFVKYKGIYCLMNFSSTQRDALSKPDEIKANLGAIQSTRFKDGFWNDFFLGTEFNTDGPESNEGGGDGDFDLDQSVNIKLPGLPALSAVDAGFISLYNPTLSQMHQLYGYLWSDLFDVATFKRLFSDPMQAIIGLSIVPFKPVTVGSKNVMFGNVDTGIGMTAIGSQYQKFDCGAVTINNFHGSALDYSPFTKISIYLPYIGIRELNADEVMGRTIQVVYYMDCLSGGCVAILQVGGSVLYQFSGQMATQIPLNSQDMSGILRNTISTAVSIGASAITGGSAAPIALANVANAALNSKPSISHSGSLSGCSGLLSVQTPYIIWETPRQSRAKEYNRFVGYPCNMTLNLSALSGFTQIETAVLDTLPCTEGEKEEIDKLLKEGVLL